MRQGGLWRAPDRQAGPPLVWWPLWAGIARSGDLGFTTGPCAFDGKPRRTISRSGRTSRTGRWKWVYDGGPPSDMTTAAPEDCARRLRPARRTAVRLARRAPWPRCARPRSPLAAAREGRREGRLSWPSWPTTAASCGSQRAAARQPRGPGGRARHPPASHRLHAPQGGEASGAGDLAWTYGAARWTPRTAGRARGHYVRIWRHDKAGWRLLFDQLLAAPPPSRCPSRHPLPRRLSRPI